MKYPPKITKVQLANISYDDLALALGHKIKILSGNKKLDLIKTIDIVDAYDLVMKYSHRKERDPISEFNLRKRCN